MVPREPRTFGVWREAYAAAEKRFYWYVPGIPGSQQWDPPDELVQAALQFAKAAATRALGSGVAAVSASVAAVAPLPTHSSGAASPTTGEARRSARNLLRKLVRRTGHSTEEELKLMDSAIAELSDHHLLVSHFHRNKWTGVEAAAHAEGLAARLLRTAQHARARAGGGDAAACMAEVCAGGLPTPRELDRCEASQGLLGLARALLAGHADQERALEVVGLHVAALHDHHLGLASERPWVDGGSDQADRLVRTALLVMRRSTTRGEPCAAALRAVCTAARAGAGLTLPGNVWLDRVEVALGRHTAHAEYISRLRTRLNATDREAVVAALATASKRNVELALRALARSTTA